MTTPSSKLLLVEDDSLVADVVRLALPHLDVYVARTREEAFALLDSDRTWCGALVDLNLTEHYQDFRGRDVLERLKVTDIPRAVLTKAKGLGDIRRNFQEAYGVTTVVIKGDRGIELSDIRQCVADMIEISIQAHQRRLQHRLYNIKEALTLDYSRGQLDIENVRKRTRRVAGSAAAERLVAQDLAQLESSHQALMQRIEILLMEVSGAVSRVELEVIDTVIGSEFSDS